jgi:nucleoside-diphosphate-sugar epimerase
VATLEPERMFSYVVDGTRAVIDGLLSDNPNVPLLYTSSGAVYGRQPSDVTHISETQTNGPDQLDPSQAYHEGKRAAELLLASATQRGVGNLRLARLFAFLGPGLPLDAHYAAGNFFADALAGRPIRIAGDGTPIRSYLYPTDMIAWSLAVFVRGADSRAYNVGSAADLSLIDVARKIDCDAHVGIDVQTPPPPTGRALNRYVPSTQRIETELGARRTVELDEAIRRTLAFYRS